jgi:hypothetical protein
MEACCQLHENEASYVISSQNFKIYTNDFEILAGEYLTSLVQLCNSHQASRVSCSFSNRSIYRCLMKWQSQFCIPQNDGRYKYMRF